MNAPRVAVVGAGIGGLTAAIALRAKGIDVEIYEAAPEPRATGTALGIAGNATKVLRALGIDLATDAHCSALEHFDLRTARGPLIRALPGSAITAELGHPFVSIHRNELIGTLREAAAGIPIHYGAEVVDVGVDRGRARAVCADGTEVLAEVLIGADGFRSAVRSTVAGDQPPNEYGYVCWLATVRFTHPRMVPGYTGHYWGRGQRFGLIDIGGGMAYWWGTKNMPAAAARDWHSDKADIVAVFDGWADEVVEAIGRTPADAIISVPGQDRPILKHWGSGPVTLLGDAAHPMLTSRSQGASSAVEDGYVLAEALARVPIAVDALRAYEDRRRGRTRMLVRSSRRLNRLEQAQNPVACAMRNFGMRHAPMRSMIRQTTRPMRFDLGWTA
ncbi:MULTISPECIES: FAD-dependent monooxygenase [unclassified Mycolicibacterium]|uniref:FAD-dependent monooxygenase n=1 Tax=unclassified Mycolicibacterium TaxID=2636767 RepID=UPI0012DFE3AE|nr:MULTISPECIES: FAD-dependent monooxygenase [unclassified Mycolicibacterium]MUL81321.1 NAD(P)-binding protein [Mycolicibacterium sp. CBMA 329]MUL87087.1 NAD(P)-binding protein [Mycolicibacterium sp. CBMA 331]MUL98631.1 NAD(P)-binding protein [Mycolicibacterium sp. CBMA 334]MUM29507.1 NAD(P)-binding protein [Mycolicibacterium sp. CBMA 295]MUM37384.1 NAD(P)-binding protein [Mycolicibacterium sp. CBMA 247]